MTRFLLDSGLATDDINRRHGVFDRARTEAQRGNRVGIAMPVLAELVAGIERSRSRERNLIALRSALPSLKLWQFDEAAAFEYGRIHAELHRIGRPMQVIDVMIAAIAMSLGNTTIVTGDSDLAAVPGLTVENWTALNNRARRGRYHRLVRDADWTLDGMLKHRAELRGAITLRVSRRLSMPFCHDASELRPAAQLGDSTRPFVADQATWLHSAVWQRRLSMPPARFPCGTSTSALSWNGMPYAIYPNHRHQGGGNGQAAVAR